MRVEYALDHSHDSGEQAILGAFRRTGLSRSNQRKGNGILTSDSSDKDGKKAEQTFIGAGIAIGVGVGLAVGSAMGNPGAGLAIGIALGVGIGAGLQRKKNAERTDT